MNWKERLARELGVTGVMLSDTIDEAIEERLQTLMEPEPAPEPAPAPAPEPEDFKVFYIAMHPGIPLERKGMDIHYESAFFDDKARPGEGNYKLPDMDRVAKVARGVVDDYQLIDIERYWTGNGRPLTDVAVNAYDKVLRQFRADMPSGVKVGLYSTIPPRNYWAPVRGGEQKEAWQVGNNKLAKLAPFVDFTAPSIYSFYDDPVNWQIYAKANIDEARRLVPGKPCFGTLWPWFHAGDYDEPVYNSFWLRQLRFCREHCDGVIIWDDRTNDRKLWKDVHWRWPTEKFLSN